MAKKTTSLSFSGSIALDESLEDFARDRRMNKSEFIRKVLRWSIAHPAEVDEKILKSEEEEIKI